MFKLLLIMSIVTYICKLFTLSIFNMQLRPILMGPLTGFILGDLPTGILFGGYLEMIYLGMFGIGGAPPLDAELAGVVAVGAAIYSKQQLPSVLIAGLISGYSGLVLFIKVIKFFSSKMAVRESTAIESGKILLFENMHRIVIIVVPLFYVPVTIGLVIIFVYGLFPFLGQIPEFFLKFLTIFTYLFPSIGLAALIKNELHKETFPYLILGFGLAVYFSTGSIVVVLLSGLLAFINIYLRPKASVLESEQQTETRVEEDDFF